MIKDRLKVIIVALTIFWQQVNAQENMIVNSGFDWDLSSWQLSGDVLPVWTSLLDVNGSTSSGSAYIVNNQVAETTDVEVLHQCLPNTSKAYIIGTWVYIPQNQAVTGSVVIRYSLYYNSNDCTGSYYGGGGRLTTETGQWVLLMHDPHYHSAVGSIEYIIAIRKTEANGEFVAYVDDAFLFSDVIFSQSFE